MLTVPMRFTICSSNLTSMFPGTLRTSLKNFSKMGVAIVSDPLELLVYGTHAESNQDTEQIQLTRHFLTTINLNESFT